MYMDLPSGGRRAILRAWGNVSHLSRCILKERVRSANLVRVKEEKRPKGFLLEQRDDHNMGYCTVYIYIYKRTTDTIA